MVETDLNTGKNVHGFHRDPSFSGWGEKDGMYNLNGGHDTEIVEKTEVDDSFELPVLQEVGLQKEGDEDQFRLSGVNMNGIGNQNENYASFDIEDTDLVYKHTNGMSRSENSIAVSNIVKTLFLILMWYIFSTLLTLYNKTLLGDDMGRFPAPLLMNTVHFAMQAVLSKGITYFWSRRFEPIVPMSRKDYFVRDGLCLSQLYQRLLQQHWIST